MLPRSKYYCGEVILPICCCFPPFPICLLLLIYIFYLTCCFLLPCLLSPEWDHLCPNRKILPRSNYYCAWRGYFANLLFSPFSHLFAFAYIYFYLTLFFLACFSVSTQVGPSVAKIFSDDFFNGTMCARDT